jgi:Fe-Mn family superoxide dismutase
MKRLNLLFFFLISIASYIQSQPFTLPPLGYSYDALEPYIDSATMHIHHTRHHQGYVNNLNRAVEGTTWENRSVIELLLQVSQHSTAIRNNGGGHYNHTLFWEILSPRAQPMPSGALAQAIQQQYGSLDKLKDELNKAASTRFGSGWAWLSVTPDRMLKVSSTANQDNPLMDVVEERGIPILGIDVWEHAYYLQYQNKRGDYLTAIWEVLDWETVSRKYEQALNDHLLRHLDPSGHKH